MTDDDEPSVWPPGMFPEPLQSASDELVDQQRNMFRQWMSMMSGNPATSANIPGFPTSPMGMATFKTRVQSGGRISIPDAEREALDIAEGDIVQAIIVPIKRGESNE